MQLCTKFYCDSHKVKPGTDSLESFECTDPLDMTFDPTYDAEVQFPSCLWFKDADKIFP